MTMIYMKILSIFIFFSLGASVESLSCTCLTVPISEYLAKNDSLTYNKQFVAFQGTVIDITIGDSVFNVFGAGNLVNLKVMEYWPKEGLEHLKGDIITVFNDDLCGINFKKDSTYLVRAVKSGLYLSTSSCEGTRLLSNEFAQEDLKFLGEGTKPTPVVREASSEIEEESSGEFDWRLFFIISAVINLILLLILFRKMKS